jgi:hypothetical protein
MLFNRNQAPPPDRFYTGGASACRLTRNRTLNFPHIGQNNAFTNLFALKRNLFVSKGLPSNPDLITSAPELDKSAAELYKSDSELDRSAVELDRSAPDLDRSAVELDRSAPELDKSAAELYKSDSELDRSAAELDNSAVEFYKLAVEFYKSGAGMIPCGLNRGPFILKGRVSTGVRGQSGLKLYSGQGGMKHAY